MDQMKVLVTDKLADLRQRHNFVDNQQALTVVLIQFAVLLEMARMEDATGRIVKEIQLLDKQLDEYLETDVI